MLWTIIMLAFGLFVVIGTAYLIFFFAVGIKGVVSAKLRGEQLRPAIPPSAQKWAAKQAARGRLNADAPIIPQPAPRKKETPEQKEARENWEERKRYLESLVDR
jgi:hypothetical protein